MYNEYADRSKNEANDTLYSKLFTQEYIGQHRNLYKHCVVDNA